MEFIHQLKEFIDPHALITNFGYIGLFLIVFAESGLFFGFFLPGDSLLIVAGVLAAAGLLNIWLLVPLVFIAAILGDQVGYWMGNRFGRRLFKRSDSLLFKQEYIEKSEAFFAKHGNKTIILARFVPIVRTFAPILAGVGRMHYSTFFTFNVVGAVLWAIGVTVAGYLLGETIEPYIEYVVVGIIVLSVIPVILHLFGGRKKQSSIATKG
mgnify:CR=1 FL=1